MIITARAESAQYAIAELQKYDAAIRPVRELAPGVRLMTLPGGWGQFAADAPPLIFVRHVFPVVIATILAGEADDCAALLTHEIIAVAPPAPADGVHSFSVQTRGSWPNAQYAVMDKLVASIEAAMTARGFVKNVKHPDKVISLFAHKNEAGEGVLYAGVSAAGDNRSRWNGGAAHYANEGVLSRAAHKLTEALEVFGLTASGRALDLGAAPGGWTNVLLDAGAHVTAVDPGALDARLAKHPQLHYVCATAQRFFAEAAKIKNANAPFFNFIVNDMKMEMYESARIMCDAAFLLAPGGHAVMTFKLKTGQGPAKIKKALDILAQKYRVAGVQQLFHNRDEVTVWLTR